MTIRDRRPARPLLAVMVAGAMLAASGLSAPVAEGARACGSVDNPYPGTRYAGSDLRRIRAVRVSCPGARRVARRAHHKALRMPMPHDGIRRFTWRGWRVTGNLHGSSDRYVAKRGRKRVSWLF
jgi:hypothetical protein